MRSITESESLSPFLLQTINHKLNIFLLQIITLTSCKQEQEVTTKEVINLKPQEIVLISKNAHEGYKHYLQQDSIGQTVENSGPYTPIKSPVFTYLNSQNNITTWTPKVNAIDTLVIPYYRDYMKLSMRNP